MPDHAPPLSPRAALWRALALWVVVLGAVRLVVAQPERCGPYRPAAVRHSIELALAWFDSNQEPDGRWLYRYRPADDEVIAGYHLVRHAGVMLSLYQAAGRGYPHAADIADRGLDAVRVRLVPTADDTDAFGDPTFLIDTGGTALVVAALTERRAWSGDDSHDELLGRMGRFLAGQVDDAGAVDAYWDPVSRRPVPERSRFYTGETTWALLRLHRAFPADGWDSVAARALRYLLHERDEAEQWFPPVADHWGAYALAEAAGADLPLGDVGPIADRWAGLFGPQVRFISQRTDSWFTTLTRGRDPVPAGVGTVGEGLGQLAMAAERLPELAGRGEIFAERTRCVAALLVGSQVHTAASTAYPRPERAQGAWLAGGITQMDDQQHALSALLFALDLDDRGPAPLRQARP